MTEPDLKIVQRTSIDASSSSRRWYNVDSPININGVLYPQNMPNVDEPTTTTDIYFYTIPELCSGVTPEIGSLDSGDTTTVESISLLSGSLTSWSKRWTITINGPDEYGNYDFYLFGCIPQVRSEPKYEREVFISFRNGWYIIETYRSHHGPNHDLWGGGYSSTLYASGSSVHARISSTGTDLLNSPNPMMQFLIWCKIGNDPSGSGSQAGAGRGDTLRIRTSWVNLGDDFDFRVFSGIGSGDTESFDFYSEGWSSEVISASAGASYTTTVEIPLSVVPSGVSEFDIATAIADATGGDTPATAYIFDIMVKNKRVRFGNSNVIIEDIEVEVI